MKIFELAKAAIVYVATTSGFLVVKAMGHESLPKEAVGQKNKLEGKAVANPNGLVAKNGHLVEAMNLLAPAQSTFNAFLSTHSVEFKELPLSIPPAVKCVESDNQAYDIDFKEAQALLLSIGMSVPTKIIPKCPVAGSIEVIKKATEDMPEVAKSYEEVISAITKKNMAMFHCHLDLLNLIAQWQRQFATYPANLAARIPRLLEHLIRADFFSVEQIQQLHQDINNLALKVIPMQISHEQRSQFIALAIQLVNASPTNEHLVSSVLQMGVRFAEVLPFNDAQKKQFKEITKRYANEYTGTAVQTYATELKYKIAPGIIQSWIMKNFFWWLEDIEATITAMNDAAVNAKQTVQYVREGVVEIGAVVINVSEELFKYALLMFAVILLYPLRQRLFSNNSQQVASRQPTAILPSEVKAGAVAAAAVEPKAAPAPSSANSKLLSALAILWDTTSLKSLPIATLISHCLAADLKDSPLSFSDNPFALYRPADREDSSQPAPAANGMALN